MLVADVTNGVGSYLVLALAVLGGVVLWRRSRATAVVLLLPVLGVFAAAAARQYPVMDRLAFFLSPIVVTLVGVVAGALVTRLGGGTAATGATLIAVLAPSVVGLARHLPPYAPQSVRPLLEVMRREVRAGDRVYVPYASWQAWVHYAPRHGLSSLPMVLGSCHYDRRQAYEDEIERLRGGGRTWTLFIPAGLVEDPGLVQRAADARGTLRLVRVERGRDARGKARDVSLFLHDFPPGGAGVLDAQSAGGERTSGEGRARLLTDPPPLPERPSAPECRGAAVPRRLARVPP
jgi:hypothetical protein